MSAADLTELLAEAQAQAAPEPGINKENKITIIAWGGDLDRIWPTLILSTTAAASGMEASVFFTFWGLFALVKPDVRITGDNWMQKMLSMMNPGSPGQGEALEALVRRRRRRMMKKLASDYKAPLPSELIETARDLGVKLIPCQMTMDLLGLKREDMIEGSRSRSAPPPRCWR